MLVPEITDVCVADEIKRYRVLVWTYNKLCINLTKCKEIVCRSIIKLDVLLYPLQDIERVYCAELLGAWVDSHM